MQDPAAAALGKAGSFDIILINECAAVVNLIVQFGSWWLEVLKFDINTFAESCYSFGFASRYIIQRRLL